MSRDPRPAPLVRGRATLRSAPRAALRGAGTNALTISYPHPILIVSFDAEERMAYQRDTTYPPHRDAIPEREVRPVPTGSEIVQLIGKLQDLRGFRDQHWEGSFEDYLQIVRHNPKVTRTAFQRIYDMLLLKGTREYYEYKKRILHYNFFDDKDHGGVDAIFGLDIPLMKLVNVFKSAAQRYGTEKRVLLLHGPVGSSKSTIVRSLKKGLQG